MKEPFILENPRRKLCPYCSSEMVHGYIQAPASYAVYWLPRGTKLPGFFQAKKYIHEAGGFFLGAVSKNFRAIDRLHSYYCPTCKCLLTFQDDSPLL